MNQSGVEPWRYADDTVVALQSESRLIMEIKVRKNGPYLVKGRIQLKDAEGNTIEADEPFALCRCGHSGTKPFCDGSHKRVGFNDED